MNSQEEEFASLLHAQRKQVRAFKPTLGIERENLKNEVEEAIRIAGLTFSLGNFQPTRSHIVVREEEKQKLLKSLFHQPLAFSASGLIFVLSDKKAIYEFGKVILEEDRASDTITDNELKAKRLFLDMGFSKGPLHLGQILKKLVLPILRNFFRIPEVPIENYRAWLSKQAGLFTSTLMTTLSLKKIGWVCLEYFDEKRILKALNLSPRRYYVSFIIAYGQIENRAHREYCYLEEQQII